ncbi:P-loop containing nucleoside triphosphate hydrolase protein [Pseudovirgaria hyperparasitica]|uniref:P-loop containing nucleoside triphosphate hydrolase protein n=1 Tax=Pseudovirgaria hyperparasitica TaxID=470096 RepID=A0A6A6WE27_9PEZI|nr:P-loop containing nucleoside triphosphate hydrolase protein [Pseudovirgaria hyperparasitica]KAF2760240.1 P-loop containing nucleoside triphosphate hydrolase protein [Pseudovirgaria hyperparasitica]
MQRRFFSQCRRFNHENPLGLPRSGAPPQLPRMQRGLPQKRSIPGVAKIVAVSSAKGGVGKSTISANLALAFARSGLRAGLLDTDIFGPSVPTLFGLSGEPRLSEKNQLIPLSRYGIKTMSMGYLVAESAPVVWRGLMVMKALQQLLHEVEWSGLDVLVLDLPPGTGDVQLTITQQLVLDGAVIVSTPQDLALKDAVKGVNMFKKVNVPLLGLVSNMSGFICPTCSSTHDIFGPSSLISKRCIEHELELLGEIPLHPSICEDADKGRPTMVAEPESPRGQAFQGIATKVANALSLSSV